MNTAQANPQPPREGGQRGMSLAEILVAMTVFVIAMAVALILYNALTKAYKRGDNAVDQQQNTRMAFEHMVTDLLEAGYNYNPDGSPSRPDEQIEGAWETAITLRADLDAKDAALSADPEDTLDGGSEIVVSTGNDEIITYALAKQDGTGGENLVFAADVQGVPRDGVVESVTVSNIALVQDSPPYTLYRITVQPDSTSVTRTPVADNIYSLRFRYLDSADNLVGPATPDDASDDVGGLDTVGPKEARENIARIEVTVVGLTSDPDLQYTDTADPYPATRKLRKFTLSQAVTPRNLGFIGRPDVDMIPPNQPQNLAACPGQCQSILLTWDAPAVEEAVRQWVTVQGTEPSFLGTPKLFQTNMGLIDGLTEGTGYYFRVRSEDSSGNISVQSDLAAPAPAVVGDVTVPEALSFFEATGGSTDPPAEEDVVHLAWNPVTTNVESVDCDPEPFKIRDLKGYRLYRSESAGSIADPAFEYLGPEWLTPQTQTYDDTNVVACRTYYYDMKAVDRCDNESDALPAIVEGSSITQYVPIQVTGLQATPAGSDTIDLQWDRVAENTDGAPILVDTYRVYRAELSPGLLPSQAAAAIDWEMDALQTDVTVSDPALPHHTDLSAILSDPTNSFYYRVSALTDCGAPYDEGALSIPNEGVSCDLGGTMALTPADGASVTGIVSVDFDVTPTGGETFTGFVTIISSSGSTVESYGSGASPLPLPISGSWDASGLPPGDYTLTATAINTGQCSETLSHTVAVLSPSSCCIAPQNPVLGPLTGKLSERKSSLLFNLINNCSQDLEVTQVAASWTDNIGTHRLGHFCYDVPSDVDPEDCDPLLTFVPPQISPISHDFSPVLPFAGTRDNSDPMIVGFKYDLALATTDPEMGETINVDLSYQLVGVPSPAMCRIVIHTNPLEVEEENP